LSVRIPSELENPAHMPVKDLKLGPVWRYDEAAVPGSKITTSTYRFEGLGEYVNGIFPSIHDERYEPGHQFTPCDCESTPCGCMIEMLRREAVKSTPSGCKIHTLWV
jgi:hypothetical protein